MTSQIVQAARVDTLQGEASNIAQLVQGLPSLQEMFQTSMGWHMTVKPAHGSQEFKAILGYIV